MLKMNARTLTSHVRVFLFQMLTEAIMHDCVIKLLKASDAESIECLCKLVTTIGKDLDHPKAKVRAKNSDINFGLISFLLLLLLELDLPLNAFSMQIKT